VSPKPEPAGKRAERRRDSRFRCPSATVGRLYVLSDDTTVRCEIEDLSTTGIGLKSSYPFEADCDVLIHIREPRTGSVLHLVATVSRSSPNSDGTWSMGCKLSRRLPRDVLDALLGK
jgi:hypothetical protein